MTLVHNLYFVVDIKVLWNWRLDNLIFDPFKPKRISPTYTAFHPLLFLLTESSLTFCSVQQSHHEAVNSQLQQQILDHLQQIIWDLQSRQSIVTTPGRETREATERERLLSGMAGMKLKSPAYNHVRTAHNQWVTYSNNRCENLTVWMICVSQAPVSSVLFSQPP